MREQKFRVTRNPFLVKPLFANEVSIVCEIKGEKETKKVEGFVRLLFTDNTGAVISEIVISSITAKALNRILAKNIKLIEEKMEEVKEKGIPEEKVVFSQSPEYIG
jgi:hypothetical protein